MNFDYPNLISELDEEKRIRFYEILAHGLTVAVRGIWSDEKLTDAQKVESMKWINEIMHRIVTKIAAMRLKRDKYSEGDFYESIKHWVSQYPQINNAVEYEIKRSYEVCSQQSNVA